MKKLIFTLFILFVLFLSEGNAQVNWITLNSGTTQELSSVVFTSNLTGYILANGHSIGVSGSILKTTNEGDSWFYINTGSSGYYDISFPSPNTGYTCSGNGTVVKTTNAGLSWTSYLVFNSPLMGLHFIDDNTGYTVGYGGTIFKTINGGVTWSSNITNYSQVMYDIFFVNSNTGFICGNLTSGGGAIVLKTTNTGTSWTGFDLPYYSINRIFFINSNVGFAIGMATQNNPAIWKTNNGGLNWSVKTTGFGSEPTQLYFLNPNVGCVVAENGLILRTANGGESWMPDNSNTSQNLLGTFITNNGIGFASGLNGTILKTTSSINYSYCGSGTHKVYICHNNHTICVDTHAVPAHLNHGDILGPCEENLRSNEEIELNTDKVKLYHNYPNPFNPSTKISFYLPNDLNAKLTIYDAAGREVILLVNEILNAGNHEYEWNAVNNSSGIYYYKLEAGETKEIQKMVLMK